MQKQFRFDLSLTVRPQSFIYTPTPTIADLMDVAQMEMSASTKNWAKMASTREQTPTSSLFYDSRVSNVEDEEAAMAEERLQFAAAMEKWKAQEAELEAGKSLSLF